MLSPGAYSSPMAISHAVSGEPIDIQPLGAQLASTKTSALFKSEDLEVIRLVLLAGKSFPPHKVAGEITIQCIEGRIDVTAEGRSHVLAAGQLLFLAAGVVHDVAALENASALVTIALKK
jgi:quercetin dioxygenase-like cupin family protein